MKAKLNALDLSDSIFDKVPYQEKYDAKETGLFHTVGFYDKSNTLVFAAIVEVFSDTVHCRWAVGAFLRNVRHLIEYGKALAIGLGKKYVSFRASRRYAKFMALRFGFKREEIDPEMYLLKVA